MPLCNISSIWWRLRKKPNLRNHHLKNWSSYQIFGAIISHCDTQTRIARAVTCFKTKRVTYRVVVVVVVHQTTGMMHHQPQKPLYLRFTFTPPPNFQIFILLFILLYYIVTSAAKSINVIPIISSCHIKQKTKNSFYSCTWLHF